MTAQQLKNSILQLAVQGKLIEQDPNDESASILFERIKTEKQKLIDDGIIKKEKALLSIIKEDIPFEIPESWKWVRLRDLCSKIGSGSTPTGGKSVYTTHGVKFIRSQNVYNDGLKLDNVAYITEEINNQKIGSTVYPNDILLNITGGSIGRCAIVPNDFDGANVNQHVMIIRLINSSINRYIHTVLISPYVQNMIMDVQVGVSREGLSATKLMNFLIPMPSLSEQHRILQCIDELLKHILLYDIAEQKLKALNKSFPEQLRKSILQAAVQGKLVEQDPSDELASVQLERIRLEKEQLIKDGKIKKVKPSQQITEDEIPFEIPESWEWVRLGTLINKITDGAHHTPKYTESGIPFLSVKDISSGIIDFNNTKFISAEDHAELYKRCDPEIGDILLTKVGTTGIPVLIDTDREFSLFVSVALLKFNQDLLYGNYLVKLLESPLVGLQCTENTRGVGNKNWVIRDIANTLVVLPPLAEQYRIVEKCEELMAMVERLR